MIWMALLVASLAGSIWLAGIRNRWTWYVLGWLAAPIAWSLVIGQAQILVMFLLTLATPFGLALAGSLKVFPALAAVYWLGRRDWHDARTICRLGPRSGRARSSSSNQPGRSHS